MISEESKIFLNRIVPLVLLLVFIPLISFIVWILYPKQELEILVIDKTVPNFKYQEHKSVFWILEHLKFTDEKGEFYDYKIDYVGFHPDESKTYGHFDDFSGLSSSQLKEKVAAVDLIYFADTYGVFENDFKENNENELSKKIHGGLNRGDINLLKEARAQKKTVVAEFNSMASPTPAGIRAEFENIMGVKWTGWIGRYFDEMDTSQNKTIPTWLIQSYMLESSAKWDFNGSGIIFINEDGRIEVFEDEIDYEGELPVIRTLSTLNQGFNLPEFIPYPDWFDVVLIERDYQVISYYDINPTEAGKEKLRTLGLPRFFPAAVFNSTEEGTLYYFSGDFADSRGSFGSAKFYGVPALWRAFHIASDYSDRQSFYWNYYYPLFSEILERAYKVK